MKLDEAIAHEKELAKEIYIEAMLCYANPDDGKLDDCIERGKYHEQIAVWLEELKFIRQWKSDVMDDFCKYDVSSFEELITNARNKAIDDFVKEICKMYVQSERNGNYRFYAVEIKQAIADLAEQLKVGANNETDNQ